MNIETQQLATPSARQRIEGRVARLLSGLPGGWLLKLVGESPREVDGLTLDAHVQFVLSVRNRHPARLISGPTPAAARRRYQRDVLAATIDAGARPTRVRAVRDFILETRTGGLRARHYRPLQSDADIPAPLLLFLHGGGFMNGDILTHDEPCRMLCQHGVMHVVSVEYRLAPEHRFPAGLEDAIAALAAVQRIAASLGADHTCVAIGGDSAGANLATVAAMDAARRGEAPAAQLLIYPALDMASRYPSRSLFGRGFLLTSDDMDAFCSLYLAAGTSLQDPRASPIHDFALADAPPALVITAGFDPLRDEGEAYVTHLLTAGRHAQLRRYDGLVHGFLHMTTIVPAARDALVETARMFRALLRDQARGATTADLRASVEGRAVV